MRLVVLSQPSPSAGRLHTGLSPCPTGARLVAPCRYGIRSLNRSSEELIMPWFVPGGGLGSRQAWNWELARDFRGCNNKYMPSWRKAAILFLGVAVVPVGRV